MDKKIFIYNVSDKRLIFRMYKELKKIKLQQSKSQWMCYNELNKQFFKKIQTTKTYLTKYLTLQTTRGMQIKTALRDYLTLVEYKCWLGCGERETIIHHWRRCKLMQPLWKSGWSFLKTLKTDLPYDSAISFLGIYLINIPRKYLHTCFLLHCSQEPRNVSSLEVHLIILDTLKYSPLWYRCQVIFFLPHYFKEQSSEDPELLASVMFSLLAIIFPSPCKGICGKKTL